MQSTPTRPREQSRDQSIPPHARAGSQQEGGELDGKHVTPQRAMDGKAARRQSGSVWNPDGQSGNLWSQDDGPAQPSLEQELEQPGGEQIVAHEFVMVDVSDNKNRTGVAAGNNS
eukprot:g63942.t1